MRAGEAKLRVRVRVVSLNAGVAAVENSSSSSLLFFFPRMGCFQKHCKNRVFSILFDDFTVPKGILASYFCRQLHGFERFPLDRCRLGDDLWCMQLAIFVERISVFATF